MKFTKKTRDGGKVDKNTPASRVVSKFGGLANMAEQTGISSSTIWGWILRGDVPPKRVPEIKVHAIRLKVKVKDSDFVRGLPEADEETDEIVE